MYNEKRDKAILDKMSNPMKAITKKEFKSMNRFIKFTSPTKVSDMPRKFQ